MPCVDAPDSPKACTRTDVQQPIPGHLLDGLSHGPGPFWALVAAWAVVCGALASNHLRLAGESLLTLTLVLLLVVLSWDRLWDLITGVDWFQPLAAGWPPLHSASLPPLPFTRPDSPGGRVFRWINRLVGWWGATFWPVAGVAFLGFLTAGALAMVLALLLPSRLRLLSGGLVLLLGLGVVQRRRGIASLAGHVFLLVGLGWLAGNWAFAEIGWPSLLLALSFSLSTWGASRIAAGLPAGGWLLNGGQAAAGVLMVLSRQPLAAGALGLTLLGLIALEQALLFGGDPAHIARRMRLWLMLSMLVAALALP